MSEAEVEAQNGEREFDAVRAASRYVPVETVSAIILSDEAFLGHGIVSNISESGACLITSTMMEPHQEICVKFTNSRRIEIFQTRARVVWSSEGMDPHLEIVGVMVGLAFRDLSEQKRREIEKVLEQTIFQEVEAPDVVEERDVLLPHALPLLR